MSRSVAKILVFLCVFLCFPIMARAAEKAADSAALRSEIVYRASFGRAEDVAILLGQGASANEVNEAGTPLIALAASRLDDEAISVIKTLADAGADLSKTDARGQTPLFYAAKAGSRAAVEYLLGRDVSYTAMDGAGNTARSVAFAAGKNDMVALLDDFARQKNAEAKAQYAEAVRKQYEDVYEQLWGHYKKYNKDLAVENKAVARIQQIISDLSFAACEASYWQTWNAAGKPTELKGKALSQAYYGSKSRQSAASDMLVGASQMDKNLVQKIAKISGEQTVYQLALSADNGQKMGTVSDMKKLCNLVAQSWGDREKLGEIR